jgi:hypothetical protein
MRFRSRDSLAVVVGLAGMVCLTQPSESAESPQQIVDSMIAAHGGMKTWASAPTVSFEVDAVGAGQTQGAPARVTVEQGRRRAYQEIPSLSSRMAWDGEKAWSQNWMLPFPPRFMAILHYYFANLPWLTRDPGVRLAAEGTAKLPGDPTEYLAVRMTFDEGVGDSPRDYYLLFIDPKTRRLRATEYVSTYAAVLPPGMKSSPPNVILYEEHATVNGLVVPTRYEFFVKEGHKPLATVRVRDWSFSKPFDEARLKMPPGAVVDSSLK